MVYQNQSDSITQFNHDDQRSAMSMNNDNDDTILSQ